MVKNVLATQETWVQSLGLENTLEKWMAIHFSILALRIPCTEEPGGLQSMGFQRVGHKWVTNTSTLTIFHTFIQFTHPVTSVWLFATRWTTVHQASLSSTNSQKLAQTHVHWVSNAIQPSHPLSSPSPPASGSFPMSQFFESGGHSIGVSASALVLPVNIQDWLPLGWTGLVYLQSKGLSRIFSNTTV